MGLLPDLSTHSRNYLGYLTGQGKSWVLISTHSRNYLGYLTKQCYKAVENLHTVEII